MPLKQTKNQTMTWFNFPASFWIPWGCAHSYTVEHLILLFICGILSVPPEVFRDIPARNMLLLCAVRIFLIIGKHIFSCWIWLRFGAPLWIKVSFSFVIDSVILLLDMYPAEPVFHWWARFFIVRIHVCHHSPAFFSLFLSWVLLLVSPGVCSAHSLLEVLVIFLCHLSVQFPVMFFLFPYLYKNFVSFAPGCLLWSLHKGFGIFFRYFKRSSFNSIAWSVPRIFWVCFANIFLVHFFF